MEKYVEGMKEYVENMKKYKQGNNGASSGKTFTVP